MRYGMARDEKGTMAGNDTRPKHTVELGGTGVDGAPGTNDRQGLGGKNDWKVSRNAVGLGINANPGVDDADAGDRVLSADTPIFAGTLEGIFTLKVLRSRGGAGSKEGTAGTASEGAGGDSAGEKGRVLNSATSRFWSVI